MEEKDITPTEEENKEAIIKKAQSVINNLHQELETSKLQTTKVMLEALSEELNVTKLRNQVNSALLESFLTDLELEAKALEDPEKGDYRIPIEAKIFMYKNTSKASTDQLGHIVNAFKSEGGGYKDSKDQVPTASNPMFKPDNTKVSKEDIDRAKSIKSHLDKLDEFLENVKKQET